MHIILMEGLFDYKLASFLSSMYVILPYRLPFIKTKKFEMELLALSLPIRER